jgi:hypothetical protein
MLCLQKMLCPQMLCPQKMLCPPEILCLRKMPRLQKKLPTGAAGLLTQLATLHAGLAKQLAVLLLRHPLATLLDYGAHAAAPF